MWGKEVLSVFVGLDCGKVVDVVSALGWVVSGRSVLSGGLRNGVKV